MRSLTCSKSQLRAPLLRPFRGHLGPGWEIGSGRPWGRLHADGFGSALGAGKWLRVSLREGGWWETNQGRRLKYDQNKFQVDGFVKLLAYFRLLYCSPGPIRIWSSLMSNCQPVPGSPSILGMTVVCVLEGSLPGSLFVATRARSTLRDRPPVQMDRANATMSSYIDFGHVGWRCTHE